jgi:hypothetical protein
MSELWGPFEIGAVHELPCLTKRPATEEDVRSGRAVFCAQGGESETFPISLPQTAHLASDLDSHVVAVIQAERVGDRVIIGYRMVDGGNGVATLPEFELSIPPAPAKRPPGSSLDEEAQTAPMFQIFYNCQETGDRLDSSAPFPADRDTALSMAQQILRADADFFGIVDDTNTTLQFMVQGAQIWMEIPAPEKRGSFGQTIAFSELEPTMLSLASPFMPASFGGMKFSSW